MKRLPLFCALLGCLLVSCQKHDALKQESSALDAVIQNEQEAIDRLDKDILALGGREGGEKFRLQLEALRTRTSALEQQNAARSKKWTAIEEEFSKLKPAAEAFKAALSQ